MTGTTIYKMTIRELNTLKTRGNTKLECYTCGSPIEVDQEIVSAIRRHGRRLRHLECAKKIGMV